MDPKVIKFEAEYRTFLSEVERLAELDPEPDSPEGLRLELLSLLVEEYEKRHFPFDKPDPIEAIKFRMNEQGLRQSDLVSYFGSRSRVSEVLNGKRPLTVQMIRALSNGLGIPAGVLIEPVSATESEDSHGIELTELDWTRFPVKEMDRHGYFRDLQLGGAQLADLARAFYTKVIPQAVSAPAFARRGLRGDAVTLKSQYALLAWKARVLYLARKQRSECAIPKYQVGAVDQAFLNQVVRLSWHQNGVRLACELVEGIGIPIVIEPHLTGTYLDGAALLDADGTPVIALTLRMDRVDHFWFTLLHELAHVAKHLNAPGDSFLDRLEDRESTEATELEANRVARDALVSRAAWRRSEIASNPIREKILKLAKELMIHPAIVAGRVRRETGDFKAFGDLLGQGEVRRLFPDVSFD